MYRYIFNTLVAYKLGRAVRQLPIHEYRQRSPPSLVMRDSSNSRLTADSNCTGSLRHEIFRYIRQFTQAQARLQVHRLFTSNKFTMVRYISLRFFLKICKLLESRITKGEVFHKRAVQ